jgi:hypothetical protein
MLKLSTVLPQLNLSIALGIRRRRETTTRVRPQYSPQYSSTFVDLCFDLASGLGARYAKSQRLRRCRGRLISTRHKHVLGKCKQFCSCRCARIVGRCHQDTTQPLADKIGPQRCPHYPMPCARRQRFLGAGGRGRSGPRLHYSLFGVVPRSKHEEAVQGKGEASLCRPTSLLGRTRRSTPHGRSQGGPACPEDSGRTGHQRTASGWGDDGRGG